MRGRRLILKQSSGQITVKHRCKEDDIHCWVENYMSFTRILRGVQAERGQCERGIEELCDGESE